MPRIKKTVETYLNEIVYGSDAGYTPTEFSFDFINFIKLVNGAQGEEHKSPIVHYRMLDKVPGKSQKIINMCSRGLAKTTVLGEYLFLYIAVYGKIPGFGKINLALYVSDSIENGVKNMRKNLEYRWENSAFLQQYLPHTRFTDVRWEFKNADGVVFIVKGYGAKALSLDTKVIMLNGSHKTIKDVAIGDYVMSPLGYQSKVVDKSNVFNRPMYHIKLEDGRNIKVCEEHLNAVTVKRNPNNTASYEDAVLDTKELLELDLQHIRIRKRKGKVPYISKENLVFIKNTKPVQFSPKKYDIDPYTLGLLLGDGSLKKDGSCILHTHVDDLPNYILSLPDNLGKPYLDKRNGTVMSIAIKGISQYVRDLHLNGVHGDFKFIPPKYLTGSIKQRMNILQGLLDTDGCIQKNGRMDFCSNSEQLVDNVSTLVRSLGGTTKKRRVKKAFRIEIWIGICPFRLPRKVNRFTGTRTKSLVAIRRITPISSEPSQCIKVESVMPTGTDEDSQFLVNDYFRTHNTGVRGAKEMGVRPQLAVLDDLVSDEDARSDTVIESIESTVNKAVNFALHPTNSKTIWSGTPFNAKDPLYKAVESGAWNVSVFPVCQEFPCTREEFRGAWEDRFDYDYVKAQYNFAMDQGKVRDFNQELMLRIMSDDDRLIQDYDISYYFKRMVTDYRGSYNFYITTDFATSEKASADFSVISVWAYNSNGDWFWVDGICKKQGMGDNINDLFRLAQEYKPQQVGVEVSGQQGGFIPWIQEQMLVRKIMFNLASENNSNKPGIRPNTNKMERFLIMEPMFKMNKIFFPEDRLNTPDMLEAMNELRLVARSGFKSKHDDFVDTISMLGSLTPWKPSEEITGKVNKGTGHWENWDEDDEYSDLDSYID